MTVVMVGGEESEEVLRREMAMGADNGILLTDDAFEGSDGKGIATLLKAAVVRKLLVNKGFPGGSAYIIFAGFG